MSSPPHHQQDQQQPQRSSAPPEQDLPALGSLLDSPQLAPLQAAVPPPADHAASMPTTSSPPPASGPGPVQAAPERSSWAGRVPSFFVLGPGGNFTPRFTDHDAPQLISVLPPVPPMPQAAGTPPASSPATGNEPSQSPPSASGQERPPPPRLTSDLSPFLQFFMPLSFGSLRDDRPDPEAAAELIRSLPTVSPEQFKRVERIIVAEQVQDGEEGDKGWKCAICLEGVDEDAKDTGIKVLPCNHLFHESCIEPWFTSNRTCPTCRLDLDPMKTLRRHPQRRGVERPAATGSGRDSPHPYSRSDSPAPGAGDQENQNRPRETAEMTFFWHIRPPTVSNANTNNVDTRAEGGDTVQQSGNGDHLRPNQNQPGAGDASSDMPTFTFEFPLRASPSPMAASDPRASASPPPGVSVPQSSEQQQQQQEGIRPQPPLPQRRPHIFVHHHHIHHPPSQPGSPSSPTPHHHHHLRPPGRSSSPLRTPTERSDNTDQNGPTEANGQQSSTPRNGEETPASQGEDGAQSPITGDGAQTDSPRNDGQSNIPHFHIFFELNAPPPPPPSEPQPEPEPIERPTLDSWVAGREKSLGWRCDAPECGIAPTDEDGDEEMPIIKEDLISIFSPLQPPVQDPEHSDHKGFMIHSCEHRWHRSCLETVERSAGHILRPDEEGRVWVRCERCRKSGWIPPARRSSSEGEVERIVA